MGITCQQCNKENEPDANYCISCGTQLEKAAKAENTSSSNSLQCNKCGTFNDLGVKYCKDCGSDDLSEKTALDVMLAYTVFPEFPKL